MGRQRSELSSKQVNSWKQKHLKLSQDEMIHLLIKAIVAIRRRTLLTLSVVTVTAVIDRTLLECKEKHPQMIEVENTVEGLQFDKFILNPLKIKSEDLTRVLEEFLIDVLDVFGKITADILTKYLYQELAAVDAVSDSKPENYLSTSTGSVQNRENK